MRSENTLASATIISTEGQGKGWVDECACGDGGANIPLCIRIQPSGRKVCISSRDVSYQVFNRWFSGLCWRWQVSDQVSFWGRFIPERIGQQNPIKMESVSSKISLDWMWGDSDWLPLPPYLRLTRQITCRSNIFLTRHPDKLSILCVCTLPTHLKAASNVQQRSSEVQTPDSTASCRSNASVVFIIMFKPDKFIG